MKFSSTDFDYHLITLLSFPHVEIRNFTYPAGVALLALDDDAERPFWRGQRMTIPTVGKQDKAIGKVRIKLGQCERGLISVGRLDDDVAAHSRSLELFTQRSSSSTQELDDWNAVVADPCPLIVSNRQPLARKYLKIGLADNQRSLDLPGDA
jgi:hypothetical protein